MQLHNNVIRFPRGHVRLIKRTDDERKYEVRGTNVTGREAPEDCRMSVETSQWGLRDVRSLETRVTDVDSQPNLKVNLNQVEGQSVVEISDASAKGHRASIAIPIGDRITWQPALATALGQRDLGTIEVFLQSAPAGGDLVVLRLDGRETYTARSKQGGLLEHDPTADRLGSEWKPMSAEGMYRGPGGRVWSRQGLPHWTR
ncbi:MAG: hypothetical protein HY319_12455 [Armatimonadetes bacterium]|nr:hypothetical protein [Armatimonadota bacterium]